MPNMTNVAELTKLPKDEIVQRIGAAILSDEEYRQNEWQGIGLVGNLAHGQSRMNGYIYDASGGFSAMTPFEKATDVLDLLPALRQVMEDETGSRWHQCLIHIWKPGPEIDILFEYDDPDRWKVKAASLDMSDYAALLRPPKMRLN